MKLRPADDDAVIEDIVGRFLKERQSSADNVGHDPALWQSFAEMGWLAMPLDENRGGIDASVSTIAVLLEALGRERVNEPYLATVVWALQLLARGKCGECERLAMAVADGSALVAVVPNGISIARNDVGDHLTGTATLVLGGNCADTLLVAVTSNQDAALYTVPAGTPGVTITPIASIDGSNVADIVLHAVAVDKPLAFDAIGLANLLSWAEDRAAALLCADAVGAIAALVARTAEYTQARHQFGKPLRAFQAVNHMIADMQTGLEEARAAMQMAVGKIDAGPVQRRRALDAAHVKIGRRGREVGHIAVQLHGAMGVTEELDIGAYLKRLMVFDVTFGTRAEHRASYAALARNGDATDCLAEPHEHGGIPDFGLSDAGAAFRDMMTELLDREVPADVAAAQRLTTTVYAEADVARGWQVVANAHGMAAANWPAEHGGPGWDAEQQYIWAHETARRFVPVASPIGLQLVGPVLMHYGTAAQQARFLPPIIAGSEIWCQGFSEPCAGSDLASLATRAIRDGDDYIVTGTKMWTTHGHFARFMAALVRTGEARRDGISFLIIDMTSPGVSIRPIRTIGGDHEVNQVFFDDVRVPAVNLVGTEGMGWTIAKFLLEYERGGDIMSAGHRALLNEIRDLAIHRNIVADAFWTEFADVSIDIDVLEVMEVRSLLGVASHAAAPSILKLRASEIQQAVTMLGADMLGADLVRWEARRPLHDVAGIVPESALASRYLNSRATTIFGGAREIQKTLIARAVE